MQLSLEHDLPAKRQSSIAKWISAYIFVWFLAFIFERAFFIDNLQILLPTIAAIGILLYFSLRLSFQIQGNIVGEIGFVYLAFAVAYTVFPAYGILTLSSLSSGAGFQALALLMPERGEFGLQLWRHVLFIAAVAFGYLAFRAGGKPKLCSSGAFGGAERLVIRILFFGVIASVIMLWSISAPVDAYVDNYTRYANLPWIVRRLVTVCTVLKTGGTFVLLVILFGNYKRYRLYIWPFVLLRVVQEVLNSLGARIDAFMILVATAVLYHFWVRRISLRKGFLVTLGLGLAFSFIEFVRLAEPGSAALEETAFHGQGMPAGELGAVFVPALHLYAERANGTLPPIQWEFFFNDFISLIPLVDQTKWNPMYWYADNYFPDAVVPPMTLGPIALSALWGGEVGLLIEGIINGILFALLMRWFVRDGDKWQVATVYVFCYSTCIMCLKYSIIWHLVPVEKIILPVMLVVSILAKAVEKTAKTSQPQSFSGEQSSRSSSAGPMLPTGQT